MSKLDVLAVSYYFPPIAVPRAIQVYKLLDSINDNITVICCDDRIPKRDDTIVQSYDDHFKDIVRLPYKKSTFIRYLDGVTDRIGGFWVKCPDLYRQWVEQAYTFFIGWQSKRLTKPEILITFGQPMSGHLFGLECKKKASVPWIAHFSDPWTDNVYRKYDPISRKINLNLEKRVFENADALIFTSPETIELVMKKYPESVQKKAFYLPHIVDKEIFKKACEKTDSTYMIRSIGRFYGHRSPEPIFKAIREIHDTCPDLLADVKFEFIGKLGKYEFLIKKYSYLSRYINFKGMVPHKESLKAMHTSDCLLVIDAPDEFSVFFPSKLAEYLASEKFILAISPKGTTQRMVSEVGGYVADPRNMPDIVENLKMLLTNRPSRLPTEINFFDKAEVGAKLRSIFQYVLNK